MKTGEFSILRDAGDRVLIGDSEGNVREESGEWVNRRDRYIVMSMPWPAGRVRESGILFTEYQSDDGTLRVQAAFDRDRGQWSHVL